MTAGFWCAFSDAAAAPTLCIKLQINLNLLQVYSKVQESFCTGVWDLWPCLSLTSVYVCFGGGPCLAGWWLSKNRYLSKHFAPRHAPAPLFWPPPALGPLRIPLPGVNCWLAWVLSAIICQMLHTCEPGYPSAWWGGCGRSSNPSGPLLSATAAVRTSLTASVWQLPWRRG